VPYRDWLSKVDVRRNIPINMLYTSSFVNFLLGFVYLASRAGFSIILGSSGIFYGKSENSWIRCPSIDTL
jgi:hypothetical protein